jgi:hypothetical protein
LKVEELKYGEEYYEKKFYGKRIKFTMGSDGDLYWKENIKNRVWEKEDAPLTVILSYRFEKIEKQFPQIGDKYYTISMIGGQHLSIMSFEWRDSKADRRLLKVGNVFKTAEEAKETEQRIINEILKNRKIS